MSDRIEHVVTISTSTLLKVIGFGALLWLLWFVRDIVFAFFVAVLLSTLIDPVAAWAARFKIPRGLTVLIIFLVVGGLCVLLVRLLVPVIINEGKSFAENSSQLVNSFLDKANIVQDRLGVGASAGGSAWSPAFGQTFGQVFSKLSGFVHSIFTIVLTLVLTFYLVTGEDSVRNFIQSFVPEHAKSRVSVVVARIKQKLGGWLRGQLLLSGIMAVLVYIGLLLLGVEYPLLLALFAGLMEAVPYLGPTLGALPPVFIAFTQHPTTIIPALTVLAMFVIFQQIENHFLVPKIMQKAVGLNPVVCVVAIVVGVKIAGVIGGLLAIPAMTCIQVVYESLRLDTRPL